MPERWEHELRKLRAVEPDADRTWQQAQRHPRGEGMPPRRQRVVAGVVAFAVFAAAGIFAWQILQPTSPLDTSVGLRQGTTVIVTFRIADMNVHGAHGRLTVGAETTQGTVGSHCWTFSGGSGCADTVASSFADDDFVPVPRGSTLAIAGDATSVDGELDRAGEFPFPKFQGFGSITEPVTLDQPAGRYVLSFVAHADDGDVPFYFPIALVNPVSEGGALTLAVVGNHRGPAASITWGGTARNAVRGEYNWCDGTGGCVGGIPEFTTFPPPVKFLPALRDTPLAITGDLRALKGGFFQPGGPAVSNVTLDVPGTVPHHPGRYVLEIHVAVKGSDGVTARRRSTSAWKRCHP